MPIQLPPPQNRSVLYLDMNSFFASVEQSHNPLWADKPLAVISHFAPRATVLAASVEAKTYGIKTGTKLQDAQQLCPRILLTETHPVLYRSVHDRFMRILRELHGEHLRAKSIDEAALYIEPNHRTTTHTEILSRAIKLSFAQELGESIRCSIGIAPNSSLAKLATDLKKPNGFLEISLESLPDLLSTVRLTDFAGISTASERNLHQAGIDSALALYQANPEELYGSLGSWGYHWWLRLHGYEPDMQIEESPYKSLSHQHVLQKWAVRRSDIFPHIVKMADRLTHRLRRNMMQARHFSLSISLVNAKSLYFERSFDSPTSSYESVQFSLRSFFEQIPDQLPGNARKLTIGFGGLTSVAQGLQLDFTDKASTEEALSVAIESIRSEHGYISVQRGSSFISQRTSLKEQLGFGRIKDSRFSN